MEVRGLWSLRAIPRDPFSPLYNGIQVSHPGPASWGTTCQVHRPHIQKVPMLVLMICLYCLEILNFYTRVLHFHFVLGPINYGAGPGSKTLRRGRPQNVSHV